MKTEVIELKDAHVGDMIKIKDGFAKVEATGDYKSVGNKHSVNGDIVERVITQNPLIRLKRYLVG